MEVGAVFGKVGELLMGLNFNVLPTCHDKRPCFAKNGIYCTALRETYPYGTSCPFRKTYIDNIKSDGVERERKTEEAEDE